MTTQVTTSLPQWLTGCTYDGDGGNDLRNSSVTANFYDVGILSGSSIGVLGGVVGGAGLIVTAGTGMTVGVKAGSFVVPNSAAPSAGGYVSTLPTPATLTVQTADPSNPRIDIICAYVSDVGTSSSFGAVEIITGVAAPSPSAPSAPANSITLAQVTVPAAATSITSGMITDLRPFTVAAGGVLKSAKGATAGYLGALAYDAAGGDFYHNSGAGPVQMHVLPWEPVIATLSAGVVFSGAETTILSDTITTDGLTDIEIFFKWSGVASSRGGTFSFNCIFTMYIDSLAVDTFFTPEDTADSTTHSGGSWSYFTSGATGDTPAAGTHTVKVTCLNHSGVFPTTVYAASTGKIILRIEPVAM